MALKDWNKIGINRWRKNNVIVDVSQNMASKWWNTTIKSAMSNHYFYDVNFKSKSQALRFTRAYMRKH